jgi:Family of unknown function (DUF6325)
MDEVDAVDELGPVDWIVVEFPGSRFNGQIAPALLDLVERDLIRVLDLLVLKKDDDGTLEAFELSDLDEGEIGELRTYESELAMLLSEEDEPRSPLRSSPAARLRSWCGRTAGPHRLRRPCAVRAVSWCPAAVSPFRRCSPPSKLTRKKKQPKMAPSS